MEQLLPEHWVTSLLTMGSQNSKNSRDKLLVNAKEFWSNFLLGWQSNLNCSFMEVKCKKEGSLHYKFIITASNK